MLKTPKVAKAVIFSLWGALFLFFWIKSFLYLDPDFGWRIKAGEIYVNQGIPETDPFSYTMPSFPWVDHAWGTTTIFYLLYSNLGYLILSFLMALLPVVTLYLASSSVPDFRKNGLYKKSTALLRLSIFPRFFIKLELEKLHFFANLPFLLVASLLFTFFGVRAQVVSWFIFSILFYWLSDYTRWKKVRLFVPPFFLLWANLHGGFAIGLAILFLYFILKFSQTRKFEPVDAMLVILSLIISFVTPYGLGTWREVFSSISDPNLRFSIAEWMPALTMFDISMVFLISLSSIFIWKYRKKFTIFELVLFSLLLIQAISSRRQLPFWAIVALPMTTKGIFYFWQSLGETKDAKVKFGQVYTIAWFLILFIFSFHALFSFKEALYIGKGNFYPINAVSYLSQTIPAGEIFSDYGWGGYLILNLPEKRVFIDGRMPSWRWDKNPNTELASAFDTYNAVLGGVTDYREIFDKFGVDTVLTRKRVPTSVSGLYNKAENFLTLFGWEKNDFRLLEVLEKDNWKKVYEDDVSVVYQKG